jgi:hypothetical protein
MVFDCAIRFVHLSIQKFELIREKKDKVLSEIFVGLLTIVTDSIASNLELDFVN